MVMRKKNITDIIEQHLKQSMQYDREIIIQRADITTLFGCVPSQVNYVINTRFTQDQGYIVESKRGGSGYIKISRIFKNQHSHIIDTIVENMPMSLNQKELKFHVSVLLKEAVITRVQARMLLCLNDVVLDSPEGIYIRAKLFKQQLNQLKFEN